MKYQIFKLKYNHISSGFTLNKVSETEEPYNVLIFDTKIEAENWINKKQPIHNSYVIMKIYHPNYD